MTHTRSADGKYHIGGKTYEELEGSRAQVWHETAYHTSGGLTKARLMKNRHGRIVSRAKHHSAKKQKRLIKAGFITKKGHFGFIKVDKSDGKTRRKTRRSSRKMRGGRM